MRGIKEICSGEVEPWHRVICIDWLAEVCSAFQLHSKTLTLCVAMFDEVIRVGDVKPGKLQQHAVTCLVVAAKISESFLIQIKEFAEMTCGACTADDLKETEMKVLAMLGFRVQLQSVSDFIYPLLSHLGLEDKQNTVRQAEYIAETTLYSVKCAALPPTTIAAAVVSVVTGTDLDDEITEATKSLFAVQSWEDARLAVTEALEECFIHEFKNIASSHTNEISFSTKSRYDSIVSQEREGSTESSEMLSDEETSVSSSQKRQFNDTDSDFETPNIKRPHW